MSDTIFSRIIRGEIPCHRVYEDAHMLAFMDINPIARGHTLVIPKQPAPTLDALSDDAAAAVGRVLPRLCRAVIQATGARSYNILQNNGAAAHQAVFHVHFHIIPRYAGDGPGSGLGIVWPATRPEAGEIAELAMQIAAAI
ncbi:MAG: HIT family protein [Phycisphaerales bacterium]|nr:HIT family protein [Phycisphaerales bacterium]